LIAVVIGSASSLSIMKTSLWLPVIIGVVIKSINIPMILVFVDRVDTERQPEITEGFHLLSTQENEMGSTTEADMDKPRFRTDHIWQQMTTLRGTLRACLFPLLVFVSLEAGNSFRGILPYWLSREYEWSLRETGYILLGERLLTALIISLLPRLSKWIFSRGGSSSSDSGSTAGSSKTGNSDLGLARLCLCLACLGTALLGFRWTRISAITALAVLATGTGFRDAYLSYVTSKLQKHEIMRVCMALSMAQYAAINIGVFIVGEFYSFCLLKADQQHQESWMTSLPIWLCSLAFAFTLLLLLCRSI
jgi:hypothetical protein